LGLGKWGTHPGFDSAQNRRFGKNIKRRFSHEEVSTHHIDFKGLGCKDKEKVKGSQSTTLSDFLGDLSLWASPEITMWTGFNIKQRHFTSENSKQPLGRPVVPREMMDIQDAR